MERYTRSTYMCGTKICRINWNLRWVEPGEGPGRGSIQSRSRVITIGIYVIRRAAVDFALS
jgi:hypothetical protein